jgi:Golgi nucleoside diphosphatase
MNLPEISLRYQKDKKTQLTNSSTNTQTNTINNNVFVTTPSAEKAPSPALQLSAEEENVNNTQTLTRNLSLEKIKTPENVRNFKDVFTSILISYFKNDMILINNLLEISSKIVFKIDDLKQILATLLETDVTKINVEYEDMFKS